MVFRLSCPWSIHAYGMTTRSLRAGKHAWIGARVHNLYTDIEGGGAECI